MSKVDKVKFIYRQAGIKLTSKDEIIIEQSEDIAKLKAEVKRVTNIKNYQTKKLLTKNAKLKEKLSLTEKALELACEMLCGLAVWDKLEFDKAIKDNCKYFLEQAKEMMKSE